MSTRDELLELLRQYWGYTSFRPLQEDIIASVVAGQDTLGLLPTGGGKSITYQVSGLARGGLTLVVSPLIALMEDQVQNLKRRGLRALFVHSGMGYKECGCALDNAVHGGYAFLYLSPERLQTEAFLARLPDLKIGLIAVDEAHCISQWGQDFRRAYRDIARLREHLPDVPVLAVTATATPTVIEDIKAQLQFKKSRTFSSSFARPGLQYCVEEEGNTYEVLYQQLRELLGTAIVYVPYRMDVERLVSFLTARGITAASYHGGMKASQREENQQAWMSGAVRVMVATNAFGMGIDKEDVRLVAHVGLPPSLEAYYQEAGRAGRDGKGGKAVLFYSENDLQRLRYNLATKYPKVSEIQQFLKRLFAHLQLAPGDDTSRPLDFDLLQFAERRGYKPVQVHALLALLEREQWLCYRQAEGHRLHIRLGVPPGSLQRNVEGNPPMEELFRFLLNRYPQMVDQRVQVSLRDILIGMRTVSELVFCLLKSAQRKGWIECHVSSSPQLIQLNSPECPSLPVSLDWEGMRTRATADYHRMQAMVDYATSQGLCREKRLREYFGETDVQPCGRCDVCRGVV